MMDKKKIQTAERLVTLQGAIDQLKNEVMEILAIGDGISHIANDANELLDNTEVMLKSQLAKLQRTQAERDIKTKMAEMKIRAQWDQAQVEAVHRMVEEFMVSGLAEFNIDDAEAFMIAAKMLDRFKYPRSEIGLLLGYGLPNRPGLLLRKQKRRNGIDRTTYYLD